MAPSLLSLFKGNANLQLGIDVGASAVKSLRSNVQEIRTSSWGSDGRKLHRDASLMVA